MKFPVRSLFVLIITIVLAGQVSAQTWTQRAPIPGSAGGGAVCFTIAGKIYLVGGQGRTSTYAYDPATDTWEKKANMPGVSAQRAFGSAFSIGSKGYVGLGKDQALGALQSDFWSYDATADTWSPIAAFPGIPRLGALAFAVGSKGYVGGGADASQSQQADFYEYDPATDTWTRKMDISEGPLEYAATLAFDTVGFIVTGNGGVPISSSACYHPLHDSWNNVAECPGGVREAAVGFSIGNTGYVGLGFTKGNTLLADFESYDVMTDAWTTVPGVTITPRAWGVATVEGGRAYVGSGMDASGNGLSDWWQFTPAGAGVSDHHVATAQIAPTMFSTRLSVTVPEGVSKGAITLVDMLGRVVLRQNIESNGMHMLATSGLPIGFYSLGVESGDVHIRQRVIKE